LFGNTKYGGFAMNRLFIKILFVAAGLTVFLAAPSLSRAQSEEAAIGFDPQRVPWKELRYKAKNWAVSLTVALTLEALPSKEAQAELLASDRGVPHKAAGPQTLRMRLDMALDAVFRDPVQITNVVWFDSRDAAALGRYRLRRGEDDFEKIYRFTDQGVFRKNREPRSKEEARGEPNQWSFNVQTFYAHDLEQLGCPVASERLLLIYIASAAAELAKGQPLSVCVFGKRQLHRVQLKAQGRRSVTVDYVESRQQVQNPRQGEIQALAIALEAEPLASSLDKPENFSFLGMHKNIVIFLDPQSHLPLQVSGDIPKAGYGDLKLFEAELK
jgi:hypothetical protein